MNKFFRTIQDIFSIKELKVRIANTLFYLWIFRLGSAIALPGVDMEKVSSNVKGMLGLLDSFLGASFSKASVFALGVSPYISASIVMQLLSIAWPKIQKIQREGEMGRRRIAQITRILSIFLSIFQSFHYILAISRDEAIGRVFFTMIAIIMLTASTLFCMWLGEKISDKGVGNGVTMLIMVNIVGSFPGALYQEAVYRGSRGMLLFVLELLVLFLIILLVVAFSQATRRIPIQYAKQLSSSTVYGGQRQYLPFKLNNAGVMPIVFANVFVFFISWIISLLSKKFSGLAYVANGLYDSTSWSHNLLCAFLIMVFTFFYTSITINPTQIAEDMKRVGGFIPGVTSGNATARFLGAILQRITLPGALFLAVIAMFPAFAHMAGLSSAFALFYGGSSLLIMVSSMLETIQQFESYLLMRRYELMINKGVTGSR